MHDAAEFVASGEFEQRLAQGHINAQDSSFLCPPSYNDSTFNSQLSPRNIGPSSFQHRSSHEHTPESSNRNTPLKRSQRRLLKRQIR